MKFLLVMIGTNKEQLRTEKSSREGENERNESSKGQPERNVPQSRHDSSSKLYRPWIVAE